jgi:hypothetical protein
MARRKADDGKKTRGRKKKDAAETTAVKPSETLKCITEKDFNAIARRCASHQETISENAGSIGSLIKDAAEKQHLHKGAFGLWRKLHKMRVNDPNRLAEFLAHFDYYRTLSVTIGRVEYPSLDEHAEQQGQMFERTEAGEGDADDDDGGEDAPAEEGKDVRPRFQVHDGRQAG